MFKYMSNLTASQIHVISLAGETARRCHITESFEKAKIPFSFFNAIHGRNSFGDGCWPWFYDPEAFAKRNKGNFLSFGDLGCAASHITLWEQLACSQDDGWIIFEDDIVLSPRLSLAALKEVLHANGRVGITLLNHVSIFGYRYGRLPLSLLRAEARFPIWGNHCAGAYAISREAAVQLMAFLRESDLPFALDRWGSYINNDFGFCHVVPVRVVLPPQARQSFAFPSTITAMGRALQVCDDTINQSGRIRWNSPFGFPKAFWFLIRGIATSLFPANSLRTIVSRFPAANE